MSSPAVSSRGRVLRFSDPESGRSLVLGLAYTFPEEPVEPRQALEWAIQTLLAARENHPETFEEADVAECEEALDLIAHAEVGATPFYVTPQAGPHACGDKSLFGDHAQDHAQDKKVMRPDAPASVRQKGYASKLARFHKISDADVRELTRSVSDWTDGALNRGQISAVIDAIHEKHGRLPRNY